MLEYIWKIDNMRVNPVKGEFTDFICEIDWSVEKREDGFIASQSGTALFETPSKLKNWSFTPYSQVTREQAIEWVKDQLFNQLVMLHPKMDEKKNYTPAKYISKLTSVYSQLDSIIEEKKNPKIVTKPLPW